MSQTYRSRRYQDLVWFIIVYVIIGSLFAIIFPGSASAVPSNNLGHTNVKANSGNMQIITDTDPALLIIISSLVSVVTILLIDFIIIKIIYPKPYQTLYYKHNVRKAKFSDIIRSTDGMPSLSVFQFALWAHVAMFVFLTTYLIRILGGVFNVPEMQSNNLLMIIGISCAVPIISNLLSSHNFAKFRSASMDREDFLPPVSNMLKENNITTIPRLQMFIWTVIGTSIYLYSFLLTTAHLPADLQNLVVPDISPILVLLMALSQGVFLVSKMGKREYPETLPVESGIEGNNLYTGASSDNTRKVALEFVKATEDTTILEKSKLQKSTEMIDFIYRNLLYSVVQFKEHQILLLMQILLLNMLQLMEAISILILSSHLRFFFHYFSALMVELSL
jgi:hypothetical protein